MIFVHAKERKSESNEGYSVRADDETNRDIDLLPQERNGPFLGCSSLESGPHILRPKLRQKCLRISLSRLAAHSAVSPKFSRRFSLTAGFSGAAKFSCGVKLQLNWTAVNSCKLTSRSIGI
jgi:hypothetical protein